MQVWFRPARMHGHPERTPIKATITKDRGNGIVDLTYDDGEFSGNARAVPNALRLPRNVREQVAVWWDVGFEMDFQTAVDNSLKKKKNDPPPQPSPTPQAEQATTTEAATPKAGVTTGAALGGVYAELPRAGAIGYASVVDVDSYVTRMTIGPRLPGVRDIALWTTDQMRYFADRTHALRMQAAAKAAPRRRLVREPLTDEQLAEMMRDTWGCASIAPRHALEFARAVERAHGIAQKGGA